MESILLPVLVDTAVEDRGNWIEEMERPFATLSVPYAGVPRCETIGEKLEVHVPRVMRSHASPNSINLPSTS